MKMKIISSVIMMALAAGMTARADYLYWMVDQGSSGIAFDYATIRSSDSSSYLYLADQSGTTSQTEVYGEDYPAGLSLSTGKVYSDLAGYGGPDSSYIIELWMESGSSSLTIAMATVDWDDLRLNTYSTLGTIGIGDAYVATAFAPVPEPTSGLLLLFGIAALVLRRRRVSGTTEPCARGMRAPAVCVFAVLGGFVVNAAQNDVVVTFSTPGPDRYADGVRVLDGECYALVYTPEGRTFAGIQADGSEVDPESGKIVLCAPVAKEGRCPDIVFEIDAAFAAENYPSGSWSVLLLDTRKWGENGNATLAGVANGRAKLVNGYGPANGGSAAVSTSGAPLGFGGAVVTAGEASLVPEGTPAPKIVDIKVVDGYVYMTVRDTVSYLAYEAKEVNVGNGDAPVPSDSVAETVPVQGAEGREIILVKPMTGPSGFFKVGRK